MGSGGLDEPAADTDKDAVEDFRETARVGDQFDWRGGEHGGDGIASAARHFAGDAGAIDVGADRIERRAGVHGFHLGIEESGDERGGHFVERAALMFQAGALQLHDNGVEMALEYGAEQSLLVGEVLIQGSDRDAGAVSRSWPSESKT